MRFRSHARRDDSAISYPIALLERERKGVRLMKRKPKQKKKHQPRRKWLVLILKLKLRWPLWP